MNKEEKKKMSIDYKNKTKNDFIKSIPIEISQLHALLDFVDLELSQQCDHSFRFTLRFLAKNNIDSETVIPWLNSQGVFCDCEIFNIEDQI